MHLVRGTHWLEPLLPSDFPSEILSMAEQLPYQAGTQGKVGRADFKVFTGLGERTATDQLKKLVELGLVDSPTPKAREIFPALPVWFAQQLFPDLHQRLGSAL